MDLDPIHVHICRNSIAAGCPGPVCGTQELEFGLAVRVAGDGVSLAEYGPVLGGLAGTHDCCGCPADWKTLVCGDWSQQLLLLLIRSQLNLELEEDE